MLSKAVPQCVVTVYGKSPGASAFRWCARNYSPGAEPERSGKFEEVGERQACQVVLPPLDGIPDIFQMEFLGSDFFLDRNYSGRFLAGFAG